MNQPAGVSIADLDGHWDVVVIGSGPAGAMAALQLAGPGLKLLLVDRAPFPRHKVCGCCLNAVAMAGLDKAGLGHLPRELGARQLHQLSLHAEGKVAALPLTNSYAISRKALDAALTRAAVARGATFLSGTHARLSRIEDDAWLVRLGQQSGKRTVASQVVLCADGLGGDSLRRTKELSARVSSSARIGLSTILEESPGDLRDGLLYMAVGRDGYAGLVRLEDGTLNIAAALDPASLGSTHDPSSVVGSVFREAGLSPIPDLGAARWKGTRPLTQHRPSLGDQRLLILGDAAGYVEPFTGEGMAWALTSGMLVAPIVRAGLEKWHSGLVQSWESSYRQNFRHRQQVCRLLSRVLRHRVLYRSFMHLLHWNTSWASRLVDGINRVEWKGSALS